MSETATIVVRLDANPAAETLSRARDHLLAAGVIVPQPAPDELWQPSAWAAGPQARSVTVGGWRDLANNGVDLEVRRQVWHPMGNYEPPSCPACGAVAEEAGHHGIIDDWLAGTEPGLVCPGCGVVTPAGDWEGEWSFAVGSPAVVFHNWGALRPEFLTSLAAVLAGRTRVVLQRL